MQMLLGPAVGPLDARSLAAAYSWPQGSWVRAMMVLTLDGTSAGPDGLSRSISSASDRLILSEVRRLSDVVLIGAGTMRSERYQPMRARDEDRAEREALGLRPAPVVAIVSSSLALPWDEPVFTESAIRPIVITSESASAAGLQEAEHHADVLVTTGPDIDLPAALAQLRDRELSRVVCEGGPRLLSALMAQHLVDEADIAISPMMTGGGQWLTGPPLASPLPLQLQHLATDGSFLFARYQVA